MGRMNGVMQKVAICQEFGWTYQEYDSQPTYFLTLIKEKLTRDRKAEKMSQKRARYGN